MTAADLSGFIESLAELISGTREDKQDDYALAGPAEGAGS